MKTMSFEDIYISKEGRFSIGIESVSGKYFISIPVSNGFVDYEEYYEIAQSTVENYPSNIDFVNELVKKYRNQEKDEDLLIKPGKDRGVAN